MKVLLISLEYWQHQQAANDSDNALSADNRLWCEASSRVLPIQLLAIAADLLDAGHRVQWIDRALSSRNTEQIIAEARRFGPDLLFFACNSLQSQGLMATVAVETNSHCHEYLNDGMLRPANYWRDVLADEAVTLAKVTEMLTQSQR